MQNTIDLHIHSTCSDGVLSPNEIIQLSKLKHWSCFSITDHNTIDAYSPLYEKNQKLISGVEMSVQFDGVYFHMLCYNFSLQYFEEINNYLRILKKQKMEVVMSVMKKIRDENIDISITEILKTNLVLEKIKILFYANNLKDTFNKIFNENFLKKHDYYIPNVKEVIELFHKFGGICILAHPRRISKENEEVFAFIRKLMNCGIDGIECFHPCNGFNFTTELVDFSKTNGLYLSGGSDLHSNDSYFKVYEDEVDRLIETFQCFEC